MRFLRYGDLKLLKGIPYSRLHVTRLEALGRFPQRRQLGENRVGWLESEIDEFLRNLPRGPLPVAKGIIKDRNERAANLPAPRRKSAAA